MHELYVGLMSGTSIDGIDAVVASFDNSKIKIIDSVSVDYDKDTKELLHSFCESSNDEIEKAGIARVALATYEAKAVNELLKKANLKSSDIKAIGSHGQTIRHRPEKGFSIQLEDGARLAALTNIDVVCDFRSADIANQGNGAPLTQAFHKMLFASEDIVSIVLNLGGISNLTVIGKDSSIIEAFDCGPANTLIDAVCRLLKNTPFDKDAIFAKKGKVIPALLAKYLQAPYLKMPPPKSTGRETFNLDFIKDELLIATQRPDIVYDLLATLTEFTVVCCVNAIRQIIFSHKIDKARLIVCGGGAYNPLIMQRLSDSLLKNQVTVLKADDLGVDSKLIEAHAFAYFAYKFVKREPLDLASSTGALKPSILGCLYPATR